jgi:Flp pilus assembly protein CpaB
MQLVQKMLSTRGGTIALGGVAALLAAFVLVLYLNQYRSSVAADSEPVTVLVAKRLIEKGMPGDVVGVRRLFDSEESPRNQVREGAITDPSTLRGRVAVEDIYPGQQLTVTDFEMTTSALGATLAGKNRAISLPLDSARGLIGKAEAGDRVDVYASLKIPTSTGRERPIVKVLAQNALVLDAPEGATAGVAAGGTQTANVVLRVNRDQAIQMAYTIDNGKIWLVLRPRAGAPAGIPGAITDNAILADIKPAKVYAKVRQRIGGQP